MAAAIAILKPFKKSIGAFSVNRVLPAMATRSVGPFVFVDLGSMPLPKPGAPEKPMPAVLPHPHIGIATVTYLWDDTADGSATARVLHRDSLGSEQIIGPADVNWMVSGRGIAHSERVSGGGATMLQTWYALPAEQEQTEPSFTYVPAHDVPCVEAASVGDSAGAPSAAGAASAVGTAVSVRVLAGSAYGLRSPVPVFNNTLYAACTLRAGGVLRAPPRSEHAERGVLLIGGDATVTVAAAAGMGGSGVRQALQQYEIAVLPPTGDDDEFVVTSEGGARVMLLGGDPLDGPRRMVWNWVASEGRGDLIESAKRDWADQNAVRFPPVPGEEGQGWIPYTGK